MGTESEDDKDGGAGGGEGVRHVEEREEEELVEEEVVPHRQRHVDSRRPHRPSHRRCQLPHLSAQPTLQAQPFQGQQRRPSLHRPYARYHAR
jgi:hypothetical protein